MRLPQVESAAGADLGHRHPQPRADERGVDRLDRPEEPAAARVAPYPWGVKPRAVMLIGKNRAETTLATAALYCAGARLVDSNADLVLLVEAKAARERRHGLRAPLVAIVPPGEKRKALA